MRVPRTIFAFRRFKTWRKHICEWPLWKLSYECRMSTAFFPQLLIPLHIYMKMRKVVSWLDCCVAVAKCILQCQMGVVCNCELKPCDMAIGYVRGNLQKLIHGPSFLWIDISRANFRNYILSLKSYKLNTDLVLEDSLYLSK